MMRETDEVVEKDCETCGGEGEVMVDSMSVLGIPGGLMPALCPDCQWDYPA